jgi:homoaconitate hydratase
VTNLRRQATAFHEQLEKTPNAADLLSSAPVVDTPQTMTEKIFQRYSVGLAPGKKVRAGDFITIQPHHCMSECCGTYCLDSRLMVLGST